MLLGKIVGNCVQLLVNWNIAHWFFGPHVATTSAITRTDQPQPKHQSKPKAFKPAAGALCSLKKKGATEVNGAETAHEDYIRVKISFFYD